MTRSGNCAVVPPSFRDYGGRQSAGPSLCPPHPPPAIDVPHEQRDPGRSRALVAHRRDGGRSGGRRVSGPPRLHRQPVVDARRGRVGGFGGVHVELPRLPGHGTAVEDMVPTRWADWSAEVEAAYQRLAERAERIVVGGLSMGGSLTLWTGLQHPEVAGLVCVNPATTPQAPEVMEMLARRARRRHRAHAGHRQRHRRPRRGRDRLRKHTAAARSCRCSMTDWRRWPTGTAS